MREKNPIFCVFINLKWAGLGDLALCFLPELDVGHLKKKKKITT